MDDKKCTLDKIRHGYRMIETKVEIMVFILLIFVPISKL